MANGRLLFQALSDLLFMYFKSLFSGLHYAGPVESVHLLPFWPDPLFSQGKNKILFLQKAINKQSASVILDLL